MKTTVACLLALCFALSPGWVRAGVDPAMLVDDPELTYASEIPTPEEVLGFGVGEWHARPDQIVAYAERLAASSDRVELTIQGRTHELRPQPLLVISSPDNLARLETIVEEHRALSEGGPAPSPEELTGMPVVVWLGYSIHGNEASGANASLLVAYHLAAGRSPQLDRMLEETVVLIDPSLNPDGLGRFASWVNQHRGEQPVADPWTREHRETWPGGRTNHYWFDLNRDWLLLQHPESRARVATLQRFRPNVVADFHEMGRGSTFFFQPGVPSRKNPLTPEENVRLTEVIAQGHAEAFDRMGRLYYSEETFDDYYYGKGSTYPDVQGAVGILFEQASLRGHVQETPLGRRTFEFAVENQFLTSLSTLEGAHRLRERLLRYQAEFFSNAMEAARRDDRHAFVFGAPEDPVRTHRMVDILLGHGIEVRQLARPVEIDGRRYEPGNAFGVPLQQRQHYLARTLFETILEFPDTTFYDVSTWSLPLSMNVPYDALTLGRREKDDPLGDRITDPAFPQGSVVGAEGSPYAYALEWTGYYAPRALVRWLRAGGRARVATRPFEADVAGTRHRFAEGTVVIPTGGQDLGPEMVRTWAHKAAEEDGVTIRALATGLTPEGVDLGSPSVEALKLPQPALLVGPGVSAYDAGATWHYLDHRMGFELPQISTDDLDEVDWSRYTHVLMVDGEYGDLPEGCREDLAQWVRSGGTLVTVDRAARWAEDEVFGTTQEGGESREPEPPAATGTRPAYADYEAERAVGLVSGAIFEIELDFTHPLAFGYSDSTLPVFRTHTRVFEPSENPYENVALYTESPLLSGYASPENQEKIAGTAAILASREGRGTWVRFADDPGFRAVWHGTQKLWANALFFGPVVKNTNR